MRIYNNTNEAFEEIKRDLSEMGILVKPKTMQDKVVEGKPEYETLELQNYAYTVLEVIPDRVEGVSLPWADEEFKERISPLPKINPGIAWELRKEIWREYLDTNREFAYTYHDRLNYFDQLNKIINRIKVDPDSRQLWLNIWDTQQDINNLGGISRVPCSLGYNFQVRNGKLNIHYIMRSCDFNTHFRNDVYLAMKLLQYVAILTNLPVGTFTQTIFSLHMYRKDAEGVF